MPLTNQDTTIPTNLHQKSRGELVSIVETMAAQTSRLSNRIATINEISVAILSALELDQIYDVVAREAGRLLGFDQCSIILYDAESDEFEVIKLSGPPLARCSHEAIHKSPAGAVIKSGQVLLFDDFPGKVPFTGSRSLLIIPLLQEEKILGTLNFAAKSQRAFSVDEAGIANMLAFQLAAAIRNARLMAELKRKENELRQRAEELELRNEELDAYNHTIAHDLKTPINGIMLNIDLVRRVMGEPKPTKVDHYLTQINSYADSMTAMIDQLLWLSRVTDVEDTMVPVPLMEVVMQALQRNQHLIEEKNVTIRIEGQLPGSLGHHRWIEEVFSNLINNAIKYMDDNKPDPYIHIRGFDVDTMVRYEVEDNGIGIADKDKIRLFDTFERLRVMDVEGHGLGLSIVARIVNKLGGKVGVESVAGEGSTFWFTLPTMRSLTAMSKVPTHRLRQRD